MDAAGSSYIVYHIGYFTIKQVFQVMAGIRLFFPVQQISFFYVPLRLGIATTGSTDEVIS